MFYNIQRAPRTASHGLTGTRDVQGCGGLERHAIDQEREIKYCVVTSIEHEYAMYVLNLGIIFLFSLLLFSGISVCCPCIHANHISTTVIM